MNPITNDSGICEESLQALKQVVDPEIGLNIVDLGLVYQVELILTFDPGWTQDRITEAGLEFLNRN